MKILQKNNKLQKTSIQTNFDLRYLDYNHKKNTN